MSKIKLIVKHLNDLGKKVNESLVMLDAWDNVLQQRRCLITFKQDC
jgi:hypothetical protein